MNPNMGDIESAPPAALAGAWLAARMGCDDQGENGDPAEIMWRAEDPAMVWEIAPTPGGTHAVMLAAGHSGPEMMDLAAMAPYTTRARVHAVVVEMPGHVFTTDEALRSRDPNLARHAGDSPDAYPHRALRVVAITPQGIGGAIVAEMGNGEPSPIVHGAEEPNTADPIHRHGVALLAARRTSRAMRAELSAEIMRSIGEHVERVAPGMDPVTWLSAQDPSTVPPEIAQMLREIAQRGVREAGLGPVLDEMPDDE